MRPQVLAEDIEATVTGARVSLAFCDVAAMTRVGDAVLAKWPAGATMHAAEVTRVNPPSVRLQVVKPGRATETDVAAERITDCADKAVGARCKLQVLLTEVQQSFLRLSTEEQDVDANLMVPGTPVLYVDGDAPAVPGIIATMQTVRQGAVEIILHDILGASWGHSAR